jgi:hypothetical protein
MREKIAHAKTEALRAREQAILCGDARLRQEWLQVATKWDALAAEYENFQLLREDG